MGETTRRILILAPTALVPLEVVRLARQPSEGAFGNGLAIMAVVVLGAVAALVYLAVGAWGLWARQRRRAIPWFIGAGIALSPGAYYVIWNVFFRRTEF